MVPMIKSLGHECEIIDCQRPDEQGLWGVLTQLRQKIGFCTPWRKLTYVIIRYPIEKYAQMLN